jgi:predicted AAA+ superfamily ATPase
MGQLEDGLKKKGEKTLYLDLDREQDRPFFDSQSRFIQRIKYGIGEKRGYVFIDEMQRKENAGLFLKGIYDMNLAYKFIVSGSGSLELKEKIHESLMGRKRIFELFPLSFEEFVNFKTGYKHMGSGDSFKELAVFFDLFKELAREYLEEYLNFGGYPRVALETEISQKQVAIDEIYQSYLERDISYLLNIQKTESLTQLVRILASQSGNLVNITELSNTLGIAVPTVKDYLWYLEKTFIIQRVSPYFRNLRKEITKASTYYFVDLGLKNYALNLFGNALGAMSAGMLFENFVYTSLREGLYLSPSTIHFWRSKDQAEVDFVINTARNIIPVEVKYSSLKEPETTRSFKSFLDKYKPEKAFIVHLGEHLGPVTYGETKVYFIPFYNCEVITQNI